MAGDRLSGLDSSFLYLERGPAHMHVASTLVFEGPPPDYEELRDHVAARLHLVPRFRQRLRFIPFGQGRPKWVDDPAFNIDYHLRHTALPAPGSDEQLRNLAARIFSQRLDRSKPLWELWLVEGLADGRFAVVGKSHHALVDGIAGVDITTVLFDTDREPAQVSGPEPWLPGPEPSDAELLAKAAVERLTSPIELARDVGAVLEAPRRALGSIVDGLEAIGALARAGISAPPSPLNVEIGPYRRFAWAQADLDDLKRTKNRHGGTVNDAILSVVAGALGRYLRAKGHSTRELELRAMVPVSVRTADERGALGNRISAVMAPLPVWSTDPVERLRVVSSRMGDLKHSRQAVGATLLTELADFAPPTVAGQAARLQAQQRFFNLVVTNVPGPQFPLYLLGRQLEAAFPMVPLAKRQAVCVAAMSYNGRINFGLIGDFDALSDIDALAGDLEAAVAELVETASDGAERRRMRRAQRAQPGVSSK